MKYLTFILLIILIFISCNKKESNPVVQDKITGLDLAIKLKQWTEMQPQKFVICVLGDTSNGKLYDVGDLVTNLVFNSNTFDWIFTDSLYIDTATAAMFDYKFTTEQLQAAYDSLTLSFSEEQMITYLHDLSLKIRMMYFDSLTNNLNLKLVGWAANQYPPKIIWSGFYSFVYEGPNSGGYSPAVYTYRGVQNLQFFTRKVSQVDLQNVLSQVDTSLSFPELKDIMFPIA